MYLLHNLLLFILTFGAGIIAIRIKLKEENIHYLLAFSGSFLLCITLLHLLPETFAESGSHTGIYILIGFFLQLFLQRLTHGVEHGHIHIASNDPLHKHAAHFQTIFLGLGIHALIEGFPLGFHYRTEATEPSLYLAVAMHKLPEVILLSSLAASTLSRKNAFLAILLFSSFTPIGSLAASLLGRKYFAISQAIVVMIPIVAGMFIHIATTILFESGTKHHLLTRMKILSIFLGILLGMLTLLFE